jgi:hypothetical protein
MQDLDVGLKSLPENCNVLKTRTDIHIEQEFLERLFSGQINDLHTSAGSDIFENRVWVPWFEIRTPFMMSDYCFYGTHNDIQKLVNYDARYDVLYDLRRGIAGTRRFIHPYLDEYPFLEYFLENYKGPDRDPNGHKNMKYLWEQRLKSRVFCAFIAFYYKVLDQDFYINYSPVKYKSVSKMENATLRLLGQPEVATEADNYTSYMQNFEDIPNTGRHDIYCTDSAWLQSHLEDPVTPDVPQEIISRVNQEFTEWRQFEPDRDHLQRDVELENEIIEPLNSTSSKSWRITAARSIVESLEVKNEAKQIIRHTLGAGKEIKNLIKKLSE